MVASGAEDFAAALDRIASRYRPAGDPAEAAVPDFPEFELALNVSAADQRLLVLLAGDEEQLTTAEKRLRHLVWSPGVQGRFHYDADPTGAWKEPLGQGAEAGAGIYLIRPDAFGLRGSVVANLPLDAPASSIRAALDRENVRFAESTEKKIYSDHVAEGRRKGISIEMAMPFGEDRDADGVIDARGRKRRR